MKKNYLKICMFLITCSWISITKAQTWGDYTLYPKTTSTVLVDMDKKTVKTWTHSSSEQNGYSVYLQPGGILWRGVKYSSTSFPGAGPVNGKVQKLDYNGNVLWDYVYSTQSYCSHHDIHPMPNGNVLLIAYERRSAAEVTAAGCTYGKEMWPDKIVEVKPTGATTGEVVWEWKTWDHLVQDKDPNKANYQSSVSEHPELINVNYKASQDWQHANGVSYNPILDQITFTSHNLNEIYVIDHSTTTAEAATHKGGNSGKGGDILYRWGNPAAYGFSSPSQVLKVTHDAHWIPEGVPNAGYLVAYNNQGISSNASCADMIETPIDGYNYKRTAGQAFGPSTYTKRQASGGYNSNMGSSQQLPNGNTLICIATAGNINEFDANGNKVWTLSTGAQSAKASRYSKCYVENPAPAIPTITVQGNTLSSSSATTYQWYYNGVLINGATSQNYTPEKGKSGIYVVRITDSNGCVYRYSTGYKYQDASGVAANELEQKFTIYPNPTSGIVTINNSPLYGTINYEVRVFDAVGRQVEIKKNVNQLDLSSYENGVYLLQISDDNYSTFTKRIHLVK